MEGKACVMATSACMDVAGRNLSPWYLEWHVVVVVVWQSLATQVRTQMNAARTKGEPVQGFNYSTTTLLNRYLKVWLSCTAFVSWACDISLRIAARSCCSYYGCSPYISQEHSLGHLKCSLDLCSALVSLHSMLFTQSSQMHFSSPFHANFCVQCSF